jgi:hypothetical protein
MLRDSRITLDEKGACNDNAEVHGPLRPLPADESCLCRLWDVNQLAAGQKGSEMTTMKLTARYARYLLTSLATVAFGMTTN